MSKNRASLVGDLAHAGRGMLMGGADVVPGVSGGTVALILGIYERLVTAISHFDMRLLAYLLQRRWIAAAEHCDLRFLAALGCGILTGIAGLASLMNYLLQHHLSLTLAAFFGLILASSVIVARAIERWNVSNAMFAVAGGAFAFWLVAQPFVKGADGYGYLFFCGAVAICAMILPGISGAFILLILGKYEYVTGAVRSLAQGNLAAEHFLVLLIFASGCGVGLLSFSKFLRWLLARYHGPTMAVLCGFMLGSLRRIWPFKSLPEGGAVPDLRHAELKNMIPEAIDGQVMAAMLLALAAIIIVLGLDWIARRRRSR